MNPFFRRPPPANEEERKVARAIAWLALVLWAVIVQLAAVLPSYSAKPQDPTG